MRWFELNTTGFSVLKLKMYTFGILTPLKPAATCCFSSSDSGNRITIEEISQKKFKMFSKHLKYVASHMLNILAISLYEFLFAQNLKKWRIRISWNLKTEWMILVKFSWSVHKIIKQKCNGKFRRNNGIPENLWGIPEGTPWEIVNEIAWGILKEIFGNIPKEKIGEYPEEMVKFLSRSSF